MRFSLTLACALLAACGGDDPIGITFTIAPIPGVETVELFIAKSMSVGTSGPPNTAPMAAKLYEVPNDRTGPSIIDAKSGFLLVNDTPESYLIETFVALGYDKDGNAIAVYQHPEQILVVPGKTEHWELTLSPAEDIVPGSLSQNPEDFRARRWKRSDNTMPSCAIVEHDGERYALGPLGDRDCDEYTVDGDEGECAPWVFLSPATQPSGFFNATCGTQATVVAGLPPACMASGASCSEVDSTTGTCTKLMQDFCVPSKLCECMPWDRDCITANLEQPTYVGSYIKCHACLDRNDYPQVDLSPLIRPSTSACTDVRMHEVGTTLVPLGDKATFATGELKITSKTGCTVDMEWNGPPPGTGRELAIVSLDLDNLKHMVVPLYVDFTCASGEPATCEAFPREPDTTRLCAVAPPTTTCGPDAACRFGPLCGDQCCGVGESCTNNVCQCAGGQKCQNGLVCGAAVGSNRCGEQCL